MSKPIFIIRFPHRPTTNEQDLKTVRENFETVANQISRQLSDYHVLAMIDSSVKKVEFESYNSNHTEIEFETLKEQVLTTIKSLS